VAEYGGSVIRTLGQRENWEESALNRKAVAESSNVTILPSAKLDPENNRAHYRTLERYAFEKGYRVRLRDGRVINPRREKEVLVTW
jgi:cysteine synthase